MEALVMGCIIIFVLLIISALTKTTTMNWNVEEGIVDKSIGRHLIEFVQRWLTTKLYLVKIRHQHYVYYFLCFEQIPYFRTEDEKQDIREAIKTDLIATYCKDLDRDCQAETDDI
jgi:hypothetical protein